MRSRFMFLAVLCVAVAPALADPGVNVLPPSITGHVASAPGQGWQHAPTLEAFQPGQSGKWVLRGRQEFKGIMKNTADLSIEGIEFDPDPTALFNVSVSNITGSTQTYMLGLVVPGLLATSPNQRYGAITSQIIDAGSDGATLAAPAGGSIYSALIDGSVVRTLQDDVFSVVAPSMGVNNALATFGWEANAVPVNTSIGINLNLTLSPGDTASFLARFDVVVPEPGALSLLALSAVGLLGRRRLA